MHSWRFYSAALLQPYIPLSHIILKMLSPWLGGNKYQFVSHWFESTRVRTQEFEFLICQNGRRTLKLFWSKNATKFSVAGINGGRFWNWWNTNHYKIEYLWGIVIARLIPTVPECAHINLYLCVGRAISPATQMEMPWDKMWWQKRQTHKGNNNQKNNTMKSRD